MRFLTASSGWWRPGARGRQVSLVLRGLSSSSSGLSSPVARQKTNIPGLEPSHHGASAKRMWGVVGFGGPKRPGTPVEAVRLQLNDMIMRGATVVEVLPGHEEDVQDEFIAGSVMGHLPSEVRTRRIP